MVGQLGKSANIQAAARVTVHFGEAGCVIPSPAVQGKWRGSVTAGRSLLRTFVRGLYYTWLDLDRATKHVTAIQLDHCAVSKLLCRQVNEAVGGVAASEGVDRDVDTLTVIEKKEHQSGPIRYRILSRFHTLKIPPRQTEPRHPRTWPCRACCQHRDACPQRWHAEHAGSVC